MRLLKFNDQDELSLTGDLQDDIPPYAILSHTWGDDMDEVNFDDLKHKSFMNKAGYAKIRFCGRQAKKDNLKYFWVDTCCINKANNTEYSEAINSMFRWYREAAKCYVYLADVSIPDGEGYADRMWERAFRNSSWFTRGWTLQELLAPASVEFFSREELRLGSRSTLERQIQEITDIPIAALRGAPLSQFSVDERMRWALKRNTKKKEDKAYCLLGIFDTFMPPIYGEGDHAFIRLNKELGRPPPSTNLESSKFVKDIKASRVKSTTSGTIRAMTVTSQVLSDYKQLIERTASELKEYLQKVDESLQQLSSQRILASAEENTGQEMMHEEMESTQQCPKTCAEVSAHINQFEPAKPQVDSGLLDGLSASQPTTNGLQHDQLSDAIPKLEDPDLTKKETKLPIEEATAGVLLPFITYPVGEPVGLASGVPSLASFAIQSTKRLCGVIEGFRNKPRIVRELNEELEALLSALRSLQDIRTDPQLDLSVCSLPLLRCGQACHAFAEIIEKCMTLSNKDKMSFRDWVRLTYQGEDIGSFRNMIAGYKSTFAIALADANL